MEDNDRRNFILQIAVSLIVFITLFSFIIWYSGDIFRRNFGALFSSVSYARQIETTNYNFQIPSEEFSKDDVLEKNSEYVSLHTIETNGILDYNFMTPQRTVLNSEYGIQDAILEDAAKAGYETVGSSQETGQSKINIQIPKVGISSPVWQGLGANSYLQKGMWVYPFGSDLTNGESVLLCHRRYFGHNDPRSCWFLDEVETGDSVFISLYEEQSFEYKVKDIKVFGANDPEIYTSLSNKDSLRIVTCHPLHSNAQRLVVYAERVPKRG